MQLYNTLSAEERAELISQAGKQRLTLSFYAYAKIQDPQQFRDELFLAWNALDALGRTYVAHEGINAQMSVPAENFEADLAKEMNAVAWKEWYEKFKPYVLHSQREILKQIG